MKTKNADRVYYAHTWNHPLVQAGFVNPSTIAITMKDGAFYYGISICSEYDNFSRKVGRQLAENRLSNGFSRIEIPEVLSEVEPQEACLQMLSGITSSLVCNNRRWLKRLIKFNHSQKEVFQAQQEA